METKIVKSKSGYLGLFFLLFFLIGKISASQQAGDLKLLNWQPKSQMIVKETKVMQSKFPVIDIHNYLRRLEYAEKYLEEMDKAGIWKYVSLDATSENDFYLEHLKVSKSVSEDKFLLFFRPDFSKIDEPDFGQKEAQRLEEAVKVGVKGLKIRKGLGMEDRDKTGELLKLDESRIDPIWEKCAEIGIPVIIHVSDPKYPSKEEILKVIAKHPKTIFIATHMANLPEKLGKISMWLEQYPYKYADINARSIQSLPTSRREGG